MTSKFTKVAIAAAVMGAVALPASQAAAGTSKTESAILGALLGGVAGAAVGHGKGESVALGAVAGAALGVAVDSSNDRNHYRSGYSYRQTRPYYADGRYSGYRANDGRYDRRYRQGSYGYDRTGYGYEYRR